MPKKSIDYQKQVSTKLSDEQYDMVVKGAKKRFLTRSAFLRYIIDCKLNEDGDLI